MVAVSHCSYASSVRSAYCPDSRECPCSIYLYPFLKDILVRFVDFSQDITEDHIEPYRRTQMIEEYIT